MSPLAQAGIGVLLAQLTATAGILLVLLAAEVNCRLRHPGCTKI